MRITLEIAAKLISSGQVVAVPTETVYGLAASASNSEAIARVFALKNRPADNPLIVHVADAAQASQIAFCEAPLFALASRFWPGPLTLVLPARLNCVSEIARAGLSTVAVRVPSHELARGLIALSGAFVAPSANVSGRPSATAPEHVESDFDADFPVLDGGDCRGGVESTVIALDTDGSWEILRSGGITREALESAFGCAPRVARESEGPRAPGMKYRHYAPTAVLVPIAHRGDFEVATHGCDAVLGFDDTPGVLQLVSLGERGNFEQNLNRLYAGLRRLDTDGYARVAVDMDFARTGLGAALGDRLEKACRK